MIAMNWFERMWDGIAYHCAFYVQFAQYQWDHLSPVGYTSMLTIIALVGVLLMGRGNKRI